MRRTRVLIALALFVAAVTVVGCRLSEPSTTRQDGDRPPPERIPDPAWNEHAVPRVWVAKWSDGENAYFRLDETGWFEAYVATRPNDMKPGFHRVEGQLHTENLARGRQEFVKDGGHVDIRCRVNDQPLPVYRYTFRVRFDPNADDLWAEYECCGRKKQFQMRRVATDEIQSASK